MITLINTDKAFDKIQHLLIIKKKPLSKVSIERMYLDIIKATCEKPTANIIMNGQISKTFSLRYKQHKYVYSHYFYSII